MTYGDIEKPLLKWFRERRDAGIRVTGKAFNLEAMRLHKAYINESFKACAMFLTRFKRKHNLSFIPTHVSQKPKEVTVVKIESFQKFVLDMRKRRHYGFSDMGNMDETPVWLEIPATVILAGLADGTKLTPLVLLPAVTPPQVCHLELVSTCVTQKNLGPMKR